MDSKSIGLCPQGFESPRCRLQGWREATENSWRLVGGCEALLAPEEVAPEETVSSYLGKKNVGHSSHPHWTTVKHEKVVESWKDNTPCGTRAHNLRTRSPTPCPLGQGASADGASKAHKLVWHGAETPYGWRQGKVLKLVGHGQRPLGHTSPQQGTRTCEHGGWWPKASRPLTRWTRELVGMGRGLMMAEGSERKLKTSGRGWWLKASKAQKFLGHLHTQDARVCVTGNMHML